MLTNDPTPQCLLRDLTLSCLSLAVFCFKLLLKLALDLIFQLLPISCKNINHNSSNYGCKKCSSDFRSFHWEAVWMWQSPRGVGWGSSPISVMKYDRCLCYLGRSHYSQYIYTHTHKILPACTDSAQANFSSAGLDLHMWNWVLICYLWWNRSRTFFFFFFGKSWKNTICHLF